MHSQLAVLFLETGEGGKSKREKMTTTSTSTVQYYVHESILGFVFYFLFKQVGNVKQETWMEAILK